MAQIRAAVVSVFLFRRSIRPHSAVAFLVEYLCFVLELLEREKEVAKLFGVICAFDTCVLTFLDVYSKLGCSGHGWGWRWRWRWNCFWFCRREEGDDQNRPFLFKFDAFLIILSMTHFTSSIISYVFHSPFLVLIPLFLAGIELIPPKAYDVFFTSEQLVLHSVDDVEAESPLQILQFLQLQIEHCQTQITFLRGKMSNLPVASSMSAAEIEAPESVVDHILSIRHG